MNQRDTTTLKVYGRAKCLAAYRQHQDGDGANTIGAGYAPPEARNIECTLLGDRLIDAGRELTALDIKAMYREINQELNNGA